MTIPQLDFVTVSAPHWVARHQLAASFGLDRWENRVCRVTGLEPGGNYRLPDGSIEIDAAIAAIVVELNRRGHITAFCCSGLPEDHSEKTYSRGYLLFAGEDELTLGPPKRVPNGVDVTWGGCHWAFSPDAAKAKKQWNELAAWLGVDLDLTDTPLLLEQLVMMPPITNTFP